MRSNDQSNVFTGDQEMPPGAIAREAAERTQEAARRSRARSRSNSGLLRAREMPRFAFEGRRTDVRGWRVFTSDAQMVGTVESVLVDVRTGSVRYLGIALSDADAPVGRGTVLVPVGVTARPGDRRVVVLRTISSDQLAGAPRLMRRPVTRADEDAALSALGIESRRELDMSDFYASPAFSEARLFG